jgi:hypothetical protein
VIIRFVREVHDQGVPCAEVEVGMPHQARNIDNTPVVFPAIAVMRSSINIRNKCSVIWPDFRPSQSSDN